MEEISKEKKTTDKAQKALSQLSKGEKTVNQIRKEFDLETLDGNEFNKKFLIKD